MEISELIRKSAIEQEEVSTFHSKLNLLRVALEKDLHKREKNFDYFLSKHGLLSQVLKGLDQTREYHSQVLNDLVTESKAAEYVRKKLDFVEKTRDFVLASDQYKYGHELLMDQFLINRDKRDLAYIHEVFNELKTLGF
jgi:hypothetical protein